MILMLSIYTSALLKHILFRGDLLGFFNTFPETVLLKPEPIESLEFKQEKYDLVILAYTVWFLSPSQPITAFLQNEQAKKYLEIRR